MADNTLHIDGVSDVVTLSKSRHDICMEAVIELDALCRLLPDLVHVEDDHVPHMVVRGIAGRMLRLANVLMAGIDDRQVDVADLRRRVLLENGAG